MHEINEEDDCGSDVTIPDGACKRWTSSPRGEERILQFNYDHLGTAPWRHHVTFVDLRDVINNNFLYFDFGVESETFGWVLVQYYGFFHDHPSPLDLNPNDFEYRQEVDMIKVDYAKAKGYPLLRVRKMESLEENLIHFYRAHGIEVNQ